MNTAVFAKTAGFKPGEGFTRKSRKPVIALVLSKARGTMRHRVFPASDSPETNATRFSDHSSRATRVRRSASTPRPPACDRKPSRALPRETTSGDDASIRRAVDECDSVGRQPQCYQPIDRSIDRSIPPTDVSFIHDGSFIDSFIHRFDRQAPLSHSIADEPARTRSNPLEPVRSIDRSHLPT